MRWWFGRYGLGLLAAFTLGAAVTSAPGLLHAELAAGLIRACAGDPLADGSRPLLLAGPGQDCAAGQSPVEWNTQGPKGDPGTAPQPQACPFEHVVTGFDAQGRVICAPPSPDKIIGWGALDLTAGNALDVNAATGGDAVLTSCDGGADLQYSGIIDGQLRFTACGAGRLMLVPGTATLDDCAGGPSAGTTAGWPAGAPATICGRTNGPRPVWYKVKVAAPAGPDASVGVQWVVWAYPLSYYG